MARSALQEERMGVSLGPNDEARVRRTTRSIVLGTAKVMNFEDLAEARAKRAKGEEKSRARKTELAEAREKRQSSKRRAKLSRASGHVVRRIRSERRHRTSRARSFEQNVRTMSRMRLSTQLGWLNRIILKARLRRALEEHWLRGCGRELKGVVGVFLNYCAAGQSRMRKTVT